MHHVLYHVLFQCLSQLALCFLVFPIGYALQFQKSVRILIGLGNQRRETVELLVPCLFRVLGGFCGLLWVATVKPHEESEELREGDGCFLHDTEDLKR